MKQKSLLICHLLNSIVLHRLSVLKHVWGAGSHVIQASLEFTVELRMTGKFWSSCVFLPSARNIDMPQKPAEDVESPRAELQMVVSHPHNPAEAF